MEQNKSTNGWCITCKVCGKEHPVEVVYWRDSKTLAGIQNEEMDLDCPENPGKKASYSFPDYKRVEP
jgi:hypothetical protein